MRLHDERLVDVAAGEHLDLRPLRTRPCWQQRGRVDLARRSLRRASPRSPTAYSTRLGFVKPFSLGTRRCSGICPPSKPSGTFLRAPVPFVPRPAVLPRAPARPRPTRLRSLRRPRRASGDAASSVDLLHRHEVADLRDHAADLRAVLLEDGVVDPVQPEPADRGLLVLRRSITLRGWVTLSLLIGGLPARDGAGLPRRRTSARGRRPASPACAPRPRRRPRAWAWGRPGTARGRGARRSARGRRRSFRPCMPPSRC